jgi:hypothetical protein
MVSCFPCCALCGLDITIVSARNKRTIPADNLLQMLKANCTPTQFGYLTVLNLCRESDSSIGVCTNCELWVRRLGDQTVGQKRRADDEGRVYLPVDELRMYMQDPSCQCPDVRTMTRIITSVGETLQPGYRGVPNPHFRETHGPVRAAIQRIYGDLMQLEGTSGSGNDLLHRGIQAVWNEFNGHPEVHLSCQAAKKARKIIFDGDDGDGRSKLMTEHTYSCVWTSASETLWAALLHLPNDKLRLAHHTYRF